jgi:mono/diheme cytochrome c family protein
MRNRFLGAFVGMLTVGSLVACGGGDAQPEGGAVTPAPAPAPAPPPAGGANVQLPEGVTQDMVAQGQQVFTGAGLCQTCHAADGSGTALAPSLRDTNWLNVSQGTFDELVTVITNGVPQPVEHPAPMPPRGGSQITDEQVRQVAAYVYSISHGG